MIENQILIQQNQISTNIQKIKNLMILIENLIPEKKIITNLEFSRINVVGNIKCNFCKKISYYQDINNIYYCWFHRSQYE